MATYVVINLTEEEQTDWKVRKYLPRRADKTGTFPIMAIMIGPNLHRISGFL